MQGLEELRRFALISGTLLALSISNANFAQAATVNLDSSGDVTSISDLVVGTTNYHILFLGHAPYAATFPNGELYADASIIAQAIADLLNVQTTIPNIAGTDPSGPAVNPTTTGFVLPESISASNIKRFAGRHQDASQPLDLNHLSYEYVVNGAVLPVTNTLPNQLVWAFASVETPLPAALPLFVSGLSGLAFLARRRKRKLLSQPT